jgi:cytoskeletal protein RodZ
MPPRDAVPHRAKRCWGIVLLFVLSACGLETEHEPNLRVVGPPALVRPRNAGVATTTTIRTEIGDALIISTRPTDKQLAPDPDAEPFVPDPATVRPIPVVTEPAPTTSEEPTSTDATTTTTTVATTTTPVATSIVATTTTLPDTTVVTTTTTTEPATTSTAAVTTTTVDPLIDPPGHDEHENRAVAAFANAQRQVNQCLIGPSSCDHAGLQASFSGTALAEVTTMVKGLTRSSLSVRIAAGDGYVIEFAAVNNDVTRASLSGCFTMARYTLDATGQTMMMSYESNREAYEMTQVDGRWTVSTHRALGAC